MNSLGTPNAALVLGLCALLFAMLTKEKDVPVPFARLRKSKAPRKEEPWPDPYARRMKETACFVVVLMLLFGSAVSVIGYQLLQP